MWCRHRVGEVLTTYKLLSSMSIGEQVPGLSLSGGMNPATLMQGRNPYMFYLLSFTGCTCSSWVTMHVLEFRYAAA